MADNKFGLSDALINAVRQVAENNAPLPRDERERDLARQATMKPKNLDEALTPKQKKEFAKLAPPEGEITFADKIAGAKKNTKKMQEAKKLVDATTDKMLKDDPAAGVIAKAVVGSLRLAGKGIKKIVGKEEFRVRNSDDIMDEGMFDRFKKKPKEGDIAPKTLADKLNAQNAKLKPKSKTPHPGPVGSDVKEESELVNEKSTYPGMTHLGYVPDAKSAEFDKHMDRSEYPHVREIHGPDHKEGMSAVYSSNPEAAKHARKFPGFQEVKKEETELDEAKKLQKLTPEQKQRLAQRRKTMTKAAKAAKPPKPMKQKAYVYPEGEPKGRENETPNDNPNENIITQLRKLPFEGKHRITFKNGKTHLLSPAIVNKAHTLHTNMHPSKKGDFQERLAASLESFQDAVKNPENEAPKPKGKFALGPLRPDFMQKLDQMAAAHAARQKKK